MAAPDLSCTLWNLLPRLGIKSGPPALGAQTEPPGKSHLHSFLILCPIEHQLWNIKGKLVFGCFFLFFVFFFEKKARTLRFIPRAQVCRGFHPQAVKRFSSGCVHHPWRLTGCCPCPPALSLCLRRGCGCPGEGTGSCVWPMGSAGGFPAGLHRWACYFTAH